MALDKDVLGTDLYNRMQQFNEVPIAPADMEAHRLLFWKEVAEAIIIHFKTAGRLTVPGLGLAAGATPVTGSSITGTII
jgi:hypothetical protein